MNKWTNKQDWMNEQMDDKWTINKWTNMSWINKIVNEFMAKLITENELIKKKNKWKNIWINENEQTTVRTHKWTDEQITNEEMIEKWR